MKFSAQILDMVIVIRDFNFEKENKELKESNSSKFRSGSLNNGASATENGTRRWWIVGRENKTSIGILEQ